MKTKFSSTKFLSKTLAIAALTIAACHPVYACEEQAEQYADAQDATTELQMFCQEMHKAGAIIIRRLNAGEPVNSIYQNLNKIDNKPSRDYLNYTATLANQFPRDTDPGQFAVWLYDECVSKNGGF